MAGVINLLDPDVIVLGGGASQISRLYKKRSRAAEGTRLWKRGGHACASGDARRCQRCARCRLALAPRLEVCSKYPKWFSDGACWPYRKILTSNPAV